MTRPSVSVILPVHNAGVGIQDCLRRLEGTLVESSELIIVDDGSTDETPAIVGAYARSAPHIRAVLLDRNVGVAAARNEAMRVAAGEYVWFVDWDDEWSSSILGVLLARALRTEADVVVCRATRRLPSGLDVGVIDGIGSERTMNGDEAFDLLLRGVFKGYLWSKLLRRTVLPDGMFPPMRSQSDFCGLVPVLAGARVVATVPEVLYHHVTREGSITNAQNPILENLTACRNVVHSVASALPPSGRRRALLRLYDYSAWYLSRANTALRLGSADVARSELLSVTSAMRLSEISRLFSLSINVAARSLLVKCAGLRYASVRSSYVGLRSYVRRFRAPRWGAHRRS
jgi:glycosyl transferase family 2